MEETTHPSENYSSPHAQNVTKHFNSRIVLVLGAQWGDEGKGKLVDTFASSMDLCVRFNGGSNAGHTIVVNGVKHALHLLPCGVLYPSTMNLLGNGVVIHLKTLVEEIKTLEKYNPNVLKQTFISTRAHLLFDVHQLVDAAQEATRSQTGTSIGTTKRGIGPCYALKSARMGIRVGDLFHWEEFTAKYRNLVSDYQKWFTLDVNVEDELERHKEYFELLKDQFVDSVQLMHNFIKENKLIVIEGANATMLDIDFGTYPYVTSSSTTAGGACIGTGIPPRLLNCCIGVVKAYLTRVGEGPFITELHDKIGEHLLKFGHEYGTTTGRPRRCGWLDIPMLKYTNAINSFQAINLTKLDVLTGLDEVKLCVNYKIKGQICPDVHFPTHNGEFESVEPVYEIYSGWKEDIGSCCSREDLPVNARRYVEAIEQHLNIPIKWIGVGPDRHNTIS